MSELSRPIGFLGAVTAPGYRAVFSNLLPHDARVLQILFLASLLSVGVFIRDFALLPTQMALTFAAGVTTQALFIRALGLHKVGYLSAVITCFGLSMLVRADSLWVHPLIAALAISAKFVIRVNGKHVFNPANLGAMIGVLAIPGAWVSPGQWGSDLALFGWFVGLGMIVAARAERYDVSLAFIGTFATLLTLRVCWLGQSWSVLGHQLESGALLLFTFFMISDPMTTPNRRSARIGYAIVVAAVAFAWQYVFFRPNGLIWALFLATPLVPFIDRWVPAVKFAWNKIGQNN